jgi:hypothetical protein
MLDIDITPGMRAAGNRSITGLRTGSTKGSSGIIGCVCARAPAGLVDDEKFGPLTRSLGCIKGFSGTETRLGPINVRVRARGLSDMTGGTALWKAGSGRDNIGGTLCLVIRLEPEEGGGSDAVEGLGDP